MRLTERDPGHPFLPSLQHPDGTWQPVARTDVGDLVSEDPLLTAATAADLAAQLLRPRLEPLRIVVGPDHLAVAASHVLRDGRSMHLLLGRLLTEAVPDLSSVEGRTRASDVLRLVCGHYVREPGTLVTAGLARRRSRAAIKGGRASGPVVPASRGFRVRYQRVDRRQMDHLRLWRDRTATSVSMTALVSSLWFRAVARHCGDLPDGFWLLVDTRRYGLPRFAMTWGNYAQSVYTRPHSLLDPGDVGSAIRSMLESSWPLAALALGGLRARALRRRDAGQTCGEGSRAYHLSHVAGSPTSQDWPWTGSVDNATLVSAATPAAPRSVTVQFRHLAGGLHVTTTCAADDPLSRTLPAALADLADPVALAEA